MTDVDDKLPEELVLLFDPSVRRDKPYHVAVYVNGAQRQILNSFSTEELASKHLDDEVAKVRAREIAMQQRRILRVVKL